MKGENLTIGKVVALTIAVIVIAIALYFLVFAKPFDPYFLNPEKTRLVRYATCSAVLCSNGVGSNQVDKVGCLKYEGGQCVETCKDVAGELSVEIVDPEFNNKRYCGENNPIEFDFIPTVPINLKSGEIQAIAMPKWLCMGVSIAGKRIAFTDVFQSNDGQCIMYGVGNSIIGVLSDEKEDLKNGHGCFNDVQDVALTPLMQYEKVEEQVKEGKFDKMYPSALYIDDSIGADCTTTQGPKRLGETFDLFGSCKIPLIEDDGKKFRVWSAKVGEATISLKSDIVIDATRLGLSNGQNCVATVLTKEEGIPFVKDNEIGATGDHELFPSLVEYKGDLYLYYQDSTRFDQRNYKNPYADVASDSRIRVIKYDGDFKNTKEAVKLESYDRDIIVSRYGFQDSVVKYLEPSVTVAGGSRYLAYSARIGTKSSDILGSKTWEIIVEDLDGIAKSSWRLTDDNVDQVDPFIVSHNGDLYVFYSDQGGRIMYQTSKTPPAGIVRSFVSPVPLEASAPPGIYRYPSAVSALEGLYVAYSFMNSKGDFDIKVLRLNYGGGITSFGDISLGSTNEEMPRMVYVNGELYVFFDSGNSNAETQRVFDNKVYYTKLQANGWSMPIPISTDNDAMVSVAVFNGDNRIHVVYPHLIGTFNLRSAVSSQDISSIATGIPVSFGTQSDQITIQSDKESYSRGETVKITGSLILSSTSAANKKITIKMTIYPPDGRPLDLPFEATTDGQGNFAYDYGIPSGSYTGKYQIESSYTSAVAKDEFTVT